MKITFHGAAQTVTGSKHHFLLDSGTSFFLDCGMFQGMGKETLELNRELPVDPETIDFIILSHAHIDHSGLIPYYYKKGFKGKIYCSYATYDLCKVMLMDSAHIQEQDVLYINQRRKSRGKEPIEPIYSTQDVQACLDHFVPIPYDTEAKVDDFVRVQLVPNGHILGSAACCLRITEGSDSRTITYTGDIGRYDSPLLKDPFPFPQSEVIICESTYGDRLHGTSDSAGNQLLEYIQKVCLEQKGRIVIPSFSLGRTQELVYNLNRLDNFGLLPQIPIYVDSPLANSATNITREYVRELNDEVQSLAESRTDPFGFDKLHYTQSVEDSMALNNSDHPCVIISASGMAEAGRIKHHLKHSISNPINLVLIVGYAEPNSLAGKLRAGDKEVTIFGEPHAVKADVKIIDSFSAHGDYNEMLRYLECQDPSQVKKFFLVHGDKSAQEAFKDKLNDGGFKPVYIPEKDESFEV